jgi:hypothetical protein
MKRKPWFVVSKPAVHPFRVLWPLPHSGAREKARWVWDKVVQTLCAHPRVIFGPMRDICCDCHLILEEHPNGRGRAAA